MTTRLLTETLRGAPTPRRPVWIMRQAGRYLPEYQALRAKHDFKTLSKTPELAAQVTLLPMARFPLDAAIVFADIMSPLPALGVEFDFQPGPVIATPLRTQAAVDALPNVETEALAPEVMATLRNVRRELPQKTALLGFCGAPWTLAAYLVEGKGVNGFPTLRAFAHQAPAALDALLAKLANAMAQYLIAQGQAGADAVQIFDSWAGALSLADWQRIVRPHLLHLLETVGETQLPRILFLQNAPHLLDAYAELPAEALAVDWRADIAALQQQRPERPVQGNLDPAVLLAGPEATRRATTELLHRTNPRGHIVNLGHGILPQTPLDSVEAFVRTVYEDSSTSPAPTK